jgi:HK97 family phage major capsid protein
MDPELKKLIEDQGKAFDAFKSVLEKKAGDRDIVLEEKLAKIEKSLDDAVEAKAGIEAKLADERKEREALELRLSKLGKIGAMSEAKAIAIADMNIILGRVAQQRQKSFVQFDETAFDSYKAASVKYMREGADGMSSDEVKTLTVGSDPDGGYFVTPDSSGRMVKKVYETSDMRQIASQITISSDRHDGAEDLNEAGVAYSGERIKSANSTTPQVGKWAINVYWYDTWPQASQQLLDDARIDVEAWLAGKVADRFSRFENAEFVNGAEKIRGLTSYTTASDTGSGVTWGSVGYAFTGVSGGFAATLPQNNLLDVSGLLKNHYLPNARWIMNRKTITAVRKFADTTGQMLWQPSLVAGQPEMLLGYPISRMEDLPQIAANSLSIGFGDYMQAYQIVDRQGITTQRDPFTVKPMVEFFTRKRAGGGVINFEAMKWLKFGTS